VAKALVFLYRGTTLSFTMRKVDRNVLYGSREIEVLDEAGGRCELATLADDGRTIVGRGGTAFAYLAPDGIWCDKPSLKPCRLDGTPIEPVASSFSAPVELSQTATIEYYLAHNIKSVYQLQTEDDASALLEELKSGTLYQFPYSFRGGLEADAGFLLAGADGNLFLAVGNPTRIECVGFAAPAATGEEADTDEEETDLFDFSMI
jgi:hypothetical protein